MKQKLIFFVVALLCVVYCQTLLGANNSLKIKSNTTIHIADSLSEILKKPACDTIILFDTYNYILKNRKKLKGQYLPLLYQYVNKCKKLHYEFGEMKAFDRIGLQYRYNEKYDSAIYFHTKSLQLNYKLKDSTQLYYNYNNLGQAYRMQDLNVQAISYFQKSLTVAEAIGNKRSASHTLNSLGATYVVQKEFKQAMNCFNASSEIALQRNDKRTLAYNYGSIGEVFLMQNQNDSAMHYFILSKDLIEELGGNRGLGVAYHLLAQVQFAQTNYSQAAYNFQKAITLHKKNNSKRYLALCYAYMGKINTQLNKTDSAFWYLNEGLAYAISIHSYENMIMIYDALFELNKQQGKWSKSILALQQSHAFQDSIINLAKGKEIQSLKITYETNKKEQKIILLSAENQIKEQRIRMAILVIIALLISVIAGAYIQIMRKKEARFAQDKLKQQLMLSQMNPHFIFNALGSIQSYMYKNEAKKAAGFMGNFASLTRSILNNSSAESIQLDEEVETLRNYLSLEQMRMQSSFNFEININDEIDAEFVFIPPMMIQPFIENAIKHGIKIIDYPGLIRINIKEKDHFIEFDITDNGVGINKTRNKDNGHQSKATAIFIQRMKILHKNYRKIPPFKIYDLAEEGKQGTKALLYLPTIDE